MFKLCVWINRWMVTSCCYIRRSFRLPFWLSDILSSLFCLSFHTYHLRHYINSLVKCYGWEVSDISSYLPFTTPSAFPLLHLLLLFIALGATRQFRRVERNIQIGFPLSLWNFPWFSAPYYYTFVLIFVPFKPWVASITQIIVWAVFVLSHFLIFPAT